MPRMCGRHGNVSWCSPGLGRCPQWNSLQQVLSHTRSTSYSSWNPNWHICFDRWSLLHWQLSQWLAPPCPQWVCRWPSWGCLHQPWNLQRCQRSDLRWMHQHSSQPRQVAWVRGTGECVVDVVLSTTTFLFRFSSKLHSSRRVPVLATISVLLMLLTTTLTWWSTLPRTLLLPLPLSSFAWTSVPQQLLPLELMSWNTF